MSKALPIQSTTRIITFKLEHSLLEKLDKQAQKEGMTRSEIIRRAIIFYLKQAELAEKNTPRIRVVEVIP